MVCVRYQETHQMVREVVDENGGEYQCEKTRNPAIVLIIFTILLDTDVNEFLVRQMSPLFHHQDIELLQVSLFCISHKQMFGKFSL